jgi:hypothetical protein
MTEREVLPAAELLSTVTQPGLEVFQVTTDPEVASHLFYNYQQMIEPTSRFLLFNRSRGNTSTLWQCDLADRFALAPVTDASEQAAGGHGAVSFSPDGRWIWYVCLTATRYEMRRRPLGGGAPETLLALDRARPEFGGRAITGARWLSFSHDGRRLLSVVNLEGTGRYDSRGILTFDAEKMEVRTAFETGPRNWNNKSQYAPCRGPQGEYLIALNDSYSQAWTDETGTWRCEKTPDAEPGNAGYLVDENGLTRYAYPVGRDRPRQNVSHWAWFGASLAKVFHCDAFDTAPHWRGAIMLAEPVPADDTTRHLGRHIPGGRQIELTRHITRPDVCHLCVSADAMVCDTIGYGGNGIESYLYTATLDNDADGPFVRPRYLLHPKSSWQPYWCETLPCMTPDKGWIFFNSDYPGVNGYRGARHTPQLFVIKGMAWQP